MNVNLQAMAKKIEGWLQSPIASLTALIVWSMWLMCIALAFSAVYRQIRFSASFPFVMTNGGMELLMALAAPALLYFIPRR